MVLARCACICVTACTRAFGTLGDRYVRLLALLAPLAAMYICLGTLGLADLEDW